jgi:hypothetical protein
MTTSAERPYDFEAIEKAVHVDTVADLCLKLDVARNAVIQWRHRGLDATDAAALAVTIGRSPVELWPDFTNEPPADLIWEEPPPKHRKGAAPFAEHLIPALMANPGNWARVREWPSKSSAASMAKKIAAGHPMLPGCWETEARIRGTSSVLYARYVGPDETAP